MTEIPSEEEELAAKRHDYLVTETREVLVSARSASEARSTAALMLQLTPNNKLITKSVNIEKVRK